MLIGYMGCGKTTVGQELSKLLNYRFIDMDREIEEKEGMTIKKMFMRFGEHEFRNKEAELLDKLCNVSGAIEIMTGGEGAVKKMMEKSGKYKEYENLGNDKSSSIVVSCGGGIVLDDLNCQVLKNQTTIFLDGPLDLLFDRVKTETHRPLAFMETLDESERFDKFCNLYETRKGLYEGCASHIVAIVDKNGKPKSSLEISKDIQLLCFNS